MSRLAPYSKQHETVNGPGDDRPTAMQIVREQNLVNKWRGRVILITSCTSGGIGVETARAVYSTGADIYITTRDISKGNVAAADILSGGGYGKVEVLQLDLSSFDSIRTCVNNFLQKSSVLNVLINNAGVMACPKSLTRDGFEMQFGTNHLGHFLLFNLLRSTLLASTTPAFHSRVISVSSSGHAVGQIQFDDLNYSKTPYDPVKAYAQSKLANILFANELERRYGLQGLHALSVHPGLISTGLQRHLSNTEEFMENEYVKRNSKSLEQGAATTVWAAVARELEGIGGRYLEDCGEAEACPQEGVQMGLSGYSRAAYDQSTEEKLWLESLYMVQLKLEK